MKAPNRYQIVTKSALATEQIQHYYLANGNVSVDDFSGVAGHSQQKEGL